MTHRLRQVRGASPRRIGVPAVGQEQPPVDRATRLVGGRVDADADLAVATLPSVPERLAGDPDRGGAELGQAGVIHDPGVRVDRRGHLGGEPLADRPPIPGLWPTNCCSACSLPSASRSAMGWIDLHLPSRSAHPGSTHPSGADRRAATVGTPRWRRRPSACAPGPARPGSSRPDQHAALLDDPATLSRRPTRSGPTRANLTEHYYSSISKGEIRCQDRQCPGLRRAVLLDAGSPLIDKPRYRRAGGAVWRPVEAMRLIRLLGGRLGAVRQRKAYRRRDIPQPRRRACAAHHRVVEQPSRRILWRSL